MSRRCAQNCPCWPTSCLLAHPRQDSSSWHLTRSVTTLTRSSAGCNDFHTVSPLPAVFFCWTSIRTLCFGMPASLVGGACYAITGWLHSKLTLSCWCRHSCDCLTTPVTCPYTQESACCVLAHFKAATCAFFPRERQSYPVLWLQPLKS